MNCAWCVDPKSIQDDVDPATLCLAHEAEWEGLTISELARRDAEQSAEYYDAVYG